MSSVGRKDAGAMFQAASSIILDLGSLAKLLNFLVQLEGN